MNLGDIVKGFVNIFSGKKKRELERLKYFFDEYLGTREDYRPYLVDLIHSVNKWGYDEVKEMQKLKKAELEDDDITGNDSGIFRISENIKRLDYLKDVELKLIEEELNLNGTKIGTLYQLITALQTKSGRFRKINKKDLPKKGFKGLIYF